MNWQAKCVIDSTKALLPFQSRLRRLKDRVTPYKSDVGDNLHTIRQGLRQVKWVTESLDLKGACVLEIGSGWEPLIPILYSLAGASKVFLTDLNVLLRPSSFEAALESLRGQRETLRNQFDLDPSLLDHALRADAGTSMEDRLRELRLVYMAPCDCRKLGLPTASIDVVTSRACLEHVPPDVIQDIFYESFRLLRPGGVACHTVDYSDHWEHYDKRLSRVSFLKYSEATFRWTYINPLNYQNRLRHPEYIEMLQKSGLRLLREEHKLDQASLLRLPDMQVAERFHRFSPEELATIDGWLLATRD